MRFNWTTIVGFIFAVLLSILFYRSRLRRISRQLAARYERILDSKALPTRTRCETLLNCLEGCKSIADSALRGPIQTHELQRALAEIAELLAHRHVSRLPRSSV